MKTTRRDLDSEILEKLDQFDNVVKGYDPSNPDGFISYGASGFYFKKTNDTFLKKVYVEDEIVEFENELTSTKRNITSSLLKDIRRDEKFNTAAEKFLYNIKLNNILNCEDSICFIKKYFNFYLLLTKSGKLLKISNKTKEFETNIVKKINETFNISIDLFNIKCIDAIDENTFLIATENNGIFKFDISIDSLELVVLLNNVRSIVYTHTGNIFVATDDFCAQYDIKSGMRIEKYNIIFNERQIPKEVYRFDGGILIITVPAGVQTIVPLVHYMKLDDARVGYNWADGVIEPHPFDIGYQILKTFIDDKYLYLVGKLHEKIFVWKYDLKTFAFSNEIIDCIRLDNIDGFISANDFYMFLNENKLYAVRNNELQQNFAFSENIKELFIENGEFLTTGKSGIFSFITPKFENKMDNLLYQIYDGTEPCNNIDIFVKNASRSERITILDRETKKEIIPSYYIVYNNNSVIKLMNCKSLKIDMNIQVNSATSLGGILVKNNRLFLR